VPPIRFVGTPAVGVEGTHHRERMVANGAVPRLRAAPAHPHRLQTAIAASAAELCGAFRVASVCQSCGPPLGRPTDAEPPPPRAHARGGTGLKDVRQRHPTPVQSAAARRILAGAQRMAGGCLVSPLTPSKRRPHVTIQGRQLMAARVVKAAALGHLLEADEDCHHRCENRRCVDPDHLFVCSAAEHRAHHAAMKRQTACSRCATPYHHRDARSWAVCLPCRAEAEARRRRRIAARNEALKTQRDDKLSA